MVDVASRRRTTLPAEAARAACDQPEIVARAMRGEPVGAVTVPNQEIGDSAMCRRRSIAGFGGGPS